MWFPRGHVFSPSPVLLQLVHSLKTRHHPSPLFLLPSCLLAPQLEVHLLCLISPLAIGYVYHQCTIFGAEVCMPHLGKAYQFQMGLFQTGIRNLGSLSSLWNPIIHLISICSFHYRQNLCIPSHRSLTFTPRDTLPKTEKKAEELIWSHNFSTT